MKILGVRIDNYSRTDVSSKISSFLEEEKFHQIATVNPEFILESQKNEKFKSILNKCDLNVADGIGLKYAALRYGMWLKNRIAGVDLMHEILKLANEKKLNVFLAISKNSLSSFEEIKSILQKMYPDINFNGGNISPEHSFELQASNCEIFLCNFGAPDQEIFINSVKNDTIRLAMGVGGSFDFLTGKTKRAPKIIRLLGLEWLWRLTLEPKYRLKRVFNAAIIFPIKIIFSQNNESII